MAFIVESVSLARVVWVTTATALSLMSLLFYVAEYAPTDIDYCVEPPYTHCVVDVDYNKPRLRIISAFQPLTATLPSVKPSFASASLTT